MPVMELTKYPKQVGWLYVNPSFKLAVLTTYPNAWQRFWQRILLGFRYERFPVATLKEIRDFYSDNYL